MHITSLNWKKWDYFFFIHNLPTYFIFPFKLPRFYVKQKSLKKHKQHTTIWPEIRSLPPGDSLGLLIEEMPSFSSQKKFICECRTTSRVFVTLSKRCLPFSIFGQRGILSIFDFAIFFSHYETFVYFYKFSTSSYYGALTKKKIEKNVSEYPQYLLVRVNFVNRTLWILLPLCTGG